MKTVAETIIQIDQLPIIMTHEGFYKRYAYLIALEVCGDGGVRHEHGKGSHTLVQIVEQPSHLLEKILSNVITMETA